MHTVCPQRLARLQKLVPAYPSLGPVTAQHTGPLQPSHLSDPDTPCVLPSAYLLTSAFPAVLECLARLPFSVLGGVVNQRVRHQTLPALAGVRVGSKLLHRWAFKWAPTAQDAPQALSDPVRVVCVREGVLLVAT